MKISDEIKESLLNLFESEFGTYSTSSNWLEYRLGSTKTHCIICFMRNFKVYPFDEQPNIPEHPNCACSLSPLRKILVGQATKQGSNGADYSLYYYKTLPSCYITKSQAIQMGWKPIKGNLDTVAKGKMIGGDIFKNRENKLPSAPNRIWYECDIDYNGGYRNNTRLIYSNDGLIFKTDDHYTRYIVVEL